MSARHHRIKVDLCAGVSNFERNTYSRGDPNVQPSACKKYPKGLLSWFQFTEYGYWLIVIVFGIGIFWIRWLVSILQATSLRQYYGSCLSPVIFCTSLYEKSLGYINQDEGRSWESGRGSSLSQFFLTDVYDFSYKHMDKSAKPSNSLVKKRYLRTTR